MSGHGAIGSALALGARGCQFESGCPDQPSFIRGFRLGKLRLAGPVFKGVVMVIKSLSFAFCCSLFFLPISAIKLTPSKYRDEAKEWVTTYVVSKQNKLLMNPADLQLCVNLFYFSYLRSAATVKAQDIACNTLSQMWQGWQNIAQTRMNPSLEIPYPADYAQQEALYKEFVKAQSYHRALGKTYAHAAEAAVKEHYLTAQSKDAILETRERSREVVILAFVEVKKILGELIDFASAKLRSDWIEWDDQEPTRYDLMDTVSQYIPYFAIKSFIELERVNTQASEQTWQIVSTMCGVSKQMWEAIELARASYYLAYYQELYRSMQEQNIDPAYLMIMFNEQGIIHPDSQTLYLPQ